MSESKQVTRGHNTVVDGWAEPSNPHTLKHTQKESEMLVFPIFQLDVLRQTNGPMDGWTDQPTDKAFNRVVCPQLKTNNMKFTMKRWAGLEMCVLTL